MTDETITTATNAPSRWRLRVKEPVEAIWFDRHNFAEIVQWTGGRVVNHWLLRRELKLHPMHRHCWIVRTTDPTRAGEFAFRTMSDDQFHDQYEPVHTGPEDHT